MEQVFGARTGCTALSNDAVFLAVVVAGLAPWRRPAADMAIRMLCASKRISLYFP